MTYEESDALMRDAVFQGRVKVAALKYATFIQSEDVNVPAHSARYRWAQQAASQPVLVAANLQPMVVMDGAVQAAGAAIADPQLQTAVEAVINKFL